ncbi:PCDAB protein, partial [Upupa epops]|nr:PCDAB protein [Upupa epops]
ISYSFTDTISDSGQDIFSIDRKSGELRTTGVLDFEDSHWYDLGIEARDRGTPPLAGHCTVEVEVLDVND